MTPHILILALGVLFFLLAGLRVQAQVDWTTLGFACVTFSLIV